MALRSGGAVAVGRLKNTILPASHSALQPKARNSASHRFARSRGLPCDVIDHDIILETIRSTLVTTHTRADLLPTDAVLDSFGA